MANGMAGRPEKPINWDEVEYAMMCSDRQEEVASSQGVSVDTLRRRFYSKYDEDYAIFAADLYKKGNTLLKQTQFEVAVKGNSNLLLWLGRVRLGQKEPDGVQHISPMDAILELQHQMMEMSYKLDSVQHENRELKQQLNQNSGEQLVCDDNEPEAEQELL